jgi:hypothetical protein
MNPVRYPLQAVLCGALTLALSPSVLAQIPAPPDAFGLSLTRKAPPFPVALPLAIPRPPFEFHGIRIGDQLKDAEGKFLALKKPSRYSTPGLCGFGEIDRIETCTDVLDTGEYVNVTMLDGKVAQIYVSQNPRIEGDIYQNYVLVLSMKYGNPDKLETKHYRNGVETGSSGEHVLWLNGDQYMEGSDIERAVTIGSRALDAEIAKKEHIYQRN